MTNIFGARVPPSGETECLLLVQHSAPYKLWCSRVHPSSAAECPPFGAAECPFWCKRVPPSGAAECPLLVQCNECLEEEM